MSLTGHEIDLEKPVVQPKPIGFKQSLREGVRLATGERVRLDVVLDPGAVTELVTVVQDASLLRTESGGLGRFAPKVGNPTHDSGWIVQLQPT